MDKRSIIDRDHRYGPYLNSRGIYLVRDVQFRIFLDRYTYQSIVPVAILLVGVVYWGARSNSRTWIMGGLVFLAVMVHILNAAQYSQNWGMQKKVWWELSWRAPQISPGTLLVVQMPTGYKYPEGAEIWAIANRIYYPDQNGPVLTAEVLNSDTLDSILAGQPIDRNYRRITYVQDFSSVSGSYRSLRKIHVCMSLMVSSPYIAPGRKN
jgi:hypothetical protein